MSRDPIIGRQMDYLNERIFEIKDIAKRKQMLELAKKASTSLEIEEIHMMLDDMGIRENKQ